MSKKIKGSYLLNAVGVALVFALLTGLFATNAFGTSTTYVALQKNKKQIENRTEK